MLHCVVFAFSQTYYLKFNYFCGLHNLVNVQVPSPCMHILVQYVNIPNINCRQ
jgi:hypothetical protein